MIPDATYVLTLNSSEPRMRGDDPFDEMAKKTVIK